MKPNLILALFLAGSLAASACGSSGTGSTGGLGAISTGGGDTGTTSSAGTTSSTSASTSATGTCPSGPQECSRTQPCPAGSYCLAADPCGDSQTCVPFPAACASTPTCACLSAQMPLQQTCSTGASGATYAYDPAGSGDCCP